MLKITMLDGTEREIEATNVRFEDIGISFMNKTMRCSECVTYDLVKSVSHEIEISDEMKEKSKKMQFNRSDARPRRNTSQLMS